MGNIHSAVLERAAHGPETTEDDMRTLGHVVREEIRNLAEDPSKRTLYKLLHTDNRKEINQPIGEARRQMEEAAAAATAATGESEERKPEGESSSPNSPQLVIDELASESTARTSPANSQQSKEDMEVDAEPEVGEEDPRPRVNSMCRHPKKMFLEGYRNRSNTVSSRATPAAEHSKAEDDFRQRTQSVSAIHTLKKRAIAAEKAKQEKEDEEEPGIKTLNIRTCINAILESQLVRNKLMTPLDEGEEVNDPPANHSEKGAVGEMGIHRPLLMLAAQVDAMRPLPGSSGNNGSKPEDDQPVSSQAKYTDAERYPASRVATIKPITQPPRSVPTATISSAKDYANVEVRNPFDDPVPPKQPPPPALVPQYSKEAPRGTNALEDRVRLYEMTHRQLLTREIQKVYAQEQQRPPPAPVVSQAPRPDYRLDEKEQWAQHYHPQTPAEREDIIRESRRTLTLQDDKRGKPYSRPRSPLHRDLADPKAIDAPLDLSAKAHDSSSGSPAQLKDNKAFMQRPTHPVMYPIPPRQPLIRPPQLPPPPALEKQRLPVVPERSQVMSSAASAAVSRVTVSTLLGEHSPSDILYLRCNLCESTYGSLHSFRKHFSKAHGHEPNAEHITIQTISATKDAIDRASKGHMELPAQEETTDMEKQTALQHLNLLPSNQYYESQLSRYKTGRAEDEERGATQSPPSLSPQMVMPPTSASSADKMLKCPQCGLEFPTRDWGIFSRHVRGHETGELAKCQLCGESFKEDILLVQHMSRAHPPGTPLKCRLCDSMFENMDSLASHVQNMHQRESSSTEGQYRCHFCPKSFVHESGLIAHMNEHAAEIHRAKRPPHLPPSSTFSPLKSDHQLPPATASMYSRRMSFSENMRRDFKRPASSRPDALLDDADFAKRPRSGSFPNALDFFERKIDVEHRRMLNGTTPEKLLRMPNSFRSEQKQQHQQHQQQQQQQPWRPQLSEAKPRVSLPPVKRPSTEDDKQQRGPQTARSLIDEMVETAVSELDAAPVSGGAPPEKILPRLFKGDPMEKVWMLEGKDGKDKGEMYKQAVMSMSLGKNPEYIRNVMESMTSRGPSPLKDHPQPEGTPPPPAPAQAPSPVAPLAPPPPVSQSQEASKTSENLRDSLSHAIEQSISYHLNQDDPNLQSSRLRQLMSEKPVFGSSEQRDAAGPKQQPSTPHQEANGAPESPSGDGGLQSMRQICDQIIAKSLSNFDSSKETKSDYFPSELRRNSVSPMASLGEKTPPRHPKSWDPRFKSLGGDARSPSPAQSPVSVSSRNSTDERPPSVKADSENGAK